MVNEGRVILRCGECGNYSFKTHKCTVCSSKVSDPRKPFFDDCPLPKTTQTVHCKGCRYAKRDGAALYCDAWGWYTDSNGEGFCHIGEERTVIE